jgi:hypothetical protein
MSVERTTDPLAPREANHEFMRRGRPIVMGVCNYCAGLGNVPADPDKPEDGDEKCYRCDGHGDLDSMRLSEAYDLGCRDTVARLGYYIRELEGMVATAKREVDEPTPTPRYSELRTRIGG